MNKIYEYNDLKKLVGLIPDIYIWQKYKDLPQLRESRSRIAILIGRYKTRYNLDYDEWTIYYEYEKLDPRFKKQELDYQCRLYDERIAEVCEMLRDDFVKKLLLLDRGDIELKIQELIDRRMTGKLFSVRWQTLKKKVGKL